MPKPNIDEILERLKSLENELTQTWDQILQEKRELFHYTLKEGKIQFEKSIEALQKREKTGLLKYLINAHLGHILTAPIIYSLFLPFAILDLMVSFYQHTCFRVYGIPLVDRKKYIIIDRQYLAYLNIIEKINCIYCGYGNGVIEFVREVSSRTEQYWCPIKHAQRTPDPHHRVHKFVDYGDAEDYHEKLKQLREDIKNLQNIKNNNEP